MYPAPCVGGLITNTEGEILLIKSPKWNGLYIIPGGHIEIGETMEQALKREVKEEVNLEVEVKKLIHIFDAINPPQYKEKKHVVLIDFWCELKGGRIKLQADEAESYIWVKPEAALQREDVLESVKELIRIYNEQRLL